MEIGEMEKWSNGWSNGDIVNERIPLQLVA
jgi:hypothetical protein